MVRTSRKFLTALVLLAAVVLSALGPLPAGSQALPCGAIRSPVAYAYETISVTTVAIGFTAAKLSSGSSSAIAVRVTQEVDVMRYRVDGTAPTSTVGHKRSAADTALWFCQNLGAAQFIRDTSSAGSGNLQVSYFRAG